MHAAKTQMTFKSKLSPAQFCLDYFLINKQLKPATFTGEESNFKKKLPFHTNQRMINLFLNFSEFS